MKLDARVPEDFALASTETDMLRRVAIVRFAPLVNGTPEPTSPHVQFEALRDVPVPDEFPAPPDAPPVGPTEGELATIDPAQREVALIAHEASVAAWLKNREHAKAVREARADALNKQDFTAWLTDPRTDHAKAEDHFRKVRARSAPKEKT